MRYVNRIILKPGAGRCDETARNTPEPTLRLAALSKDNQKKSLREGTGELHLNQRYLKIKIILYFLLFAPFFSILCMFFPFYIA